MRFIPVVLRFHNAGIETININLISVISVTNFPKLKEEMTR